VSNCVDEHEIWVQGYHVRELNVAITCLNEH